MFSVTVESHCQGKQNQKIPWQCDQTLCGNIPEYCKFHSSDLGKNQCKQGIKFLKLNCHSGIALAYLKRRSIVDSHHRPMFEIVVSNSKRRWAESFSEQNCVLCRAHCGRACIRAVPMRYHRRKGWFWIKPNTSYFVASLVSKKKTVKTVS